MLKDINHIKNSKFLQVFEEKVYNKGYTYLTCKSKKLKYRIEELYKPLFQTKLLKEGFLSKSFSRASVSKALLFTSINWAHLVVEKWRGKERNSSPIVYKEGGENLMYQNIVLDKL